MKRIIVALPALGNSADQVAETLRMSGVRGHRGERSFRNLVIRYLNRQLDIGGLLEIADDASILRIVQHGKAREIELPQCLSSFLAQSHQGLYPDLEGA